jgi:hypothetical protein
LSVYFLGVIGVENVDKKLVTEAATANASRAIRGDAICAWSRKPRLILVALDRPVAMARRLNPMAISRIYFRQGGHGSFRK